MNRNGITLIEIMILVAIIGLLLAIAVPSFVKAKRTQELKDAGYTDKDQISSLVSTNEEAFDLAIKNGPRSMDKTKGDGKHDEWGHSEDGQAASRPQANGHPSVDVGHRAPVPEIIEMYGATSQWNSAYSHKQGEAAMPDGAIQEGGGNWKTFQWAGRRWITMYDGSPASNVVQLFVMDGRKWVPMSEIK